MAYRQLSTNESKESKQSPKSLTKFELVQALIVRDQDELVWILEQIAEKRTDVALNTSRQTLTDRPASAGLTGDEPCHMASMVPVEATSVIQFARSEFHTFGEEESVTLYLTRTGDKKERAEVQLETRDLTAHAGVNYTKIEQKIVFEAGQGLARVSVPILPADTWEAIVEFAVGLKAVKGADLARQLSSARVKIVGGQTFPAEELKDVYEEDRELKIQWNKIKFYFEFLKLLLSDRVVRLGAIKRCLQGQLSNVSFVVMQYISVFSINFVFKQGDHSTWLFGRHEWLLLIVGTQIVSVLVLHMMDYLKLSWSVGGPGRKMIQKGLLRRYMHYNAMARSEVNSTELATAVTRNTLAIVGGIGDCIAVANVTGALLSILVFKLTAPLVFHTNKPIRILGFSPFIVYPLALGIYINMRATKTTESLDRVQAAKDNLLKYIYHAVDNFPVLHDYKRKHQVVDDIDPLIDSYNKANREKNQVVTNNTYFPHWLSTLLMAFWYLYFGRKVIEDTLSLGFFLTDLKVIEKFGKEFEKLYTILMSLESTFPDLQRIVVLLNKPLNVADNVHYERCVLEKTESLRTAYSKQGQGALDRVPMYAQDLKFTFGREFNFRGSIEVQQGQMACLVGKHGIGKSTLLKVIGGSIFPKLDRGEVFIPSHLRVLHVSFQAQFLKKPFWDNITLGAEIEEDQRRERVEQILKRLGLDQKLALLESKDDIGWQTILTVQEATMLSLARALIANPHVMCIHKPTVAKAETSAGRAMSMLREFVDERGIEQDKKHSMLKRRPRTVLYTSITHASAKYADVIYEVQSNSVQKIKFEDLDDSAFG